MASAGSLSGFNEETTLVLNHILGILIVTIYSYCKAGATNLRLWGQNLAILLLVFIFQTSCFPALKSVRIEAIDDISVQMFDRV